MIIELKGGQAQNLGAQLMLEEACRRILARFPSAKIALRQTGLLSAEYRKSFGALQKFPLRKQRFDLTGWSYRMPAWVLPWALPKEVVVESQVDAIVDLSGFAYGDRWGAGSLRATTAEILRFKARSKPYIFLPQAFGPFEKIDENVSQRFGAALASADLVAVRDRVSMAHIQGIIPQSSNNLLLAPDITFATIPSMPSNDASAVDRRTAILVPNTRMLESISNGVAAEGYPSAMLALAAACRAKGFRLVILNHGGEEDREPCERLSNALDHVPTLSPTDPFLAKAMIGASGLVISSRFHACVAALSQGVPCIATAWSHKYRELFEPFDQTYAVWSGSGSVNFGKLVHQVLVDTESKADALNAVRQTIAQDVERLWNQVLGVLAASEVER